MLRVTYLSDSDPDFQCLEKHLRDGSFGKLHDQHVYQAHHDIESQRKFYEVVAEKMGIEGEAIAQLFPNEITLPTRFESPTHYRLLSGLIDKIKEMAEGYGIDTSTFPHYSSIPTQLVNAQAVRLSCSKRSFLLFDSQIFLYCHLFAKAFSLCIPVLSEDQGISFSIETERVKDRILNVPECIDRLVDLLGALDKTKVPGRAEPYIPEPAYARLSALYLDGMELFVVAHEFGHIYANHLDSLLPRLCFPAQGGENNSSSHIQEFEADAIGLLLMISAQTKQGFDSGLSYIGAELFFHALEMQDKFTHFLEHGTDEDYVDVSSESHPSNHERRMALRAAIPQMMRSGEDLETTLKLASQYEAIIQALWSSVKARYS